MLVQIKEPKRRNQFPPHRHRPGRVDGQSKKTASCTNPKNNRLRPSRFLYDSSYDQLTRLRENVIARLASLNGKIQKPTQQCFCIAAILAIAELPKETIPVEKVHALAELAESAWRHGSTLKLGSAISVACKILGIQESRREIILEATTIAKSVQPNVDWLVIFQIITSDSEVSDVITLFETI